MPPRVTIPAAVTLFMREQAAVTLTLNIMLAAAARAVTADATKEMRETSFKDTCLQQECM
jgi:hypothetical protein